MNMIANVTDNVLKNALGDLMNATGLGHSDIQVLVGFVGSKDKRIDCRLIVRTDGEQAVAEKEMDGVPRVEHPQGPDGDKTSLSSETSICPPCMYQSEVKATGQI